MAGFNAKSARAKRPCPLWADAFLRDTQHLGADEVGVYMLLLMAMWTRESCDLPSDGVRLAKVGRVSKRLWDSRIGPVIMPFFRVENGMLISKRLRIEAEFVEKFCRLQSERKTGSNIESDPLAKPTGASERSEENGEMPCNSLNNNEPASTTDASVENPRHHPTQQPNNPTVSIGGGGSAQAREIQPQTFREKILIAVGVDPVSGLTGRGGGQLGTQGDMAEAGRWLDLPNISEMAVIEEIRRIAANKRDGPPKAFSYFTEAMQRLSASLSAPALQPSKPNPQSANGGQHERHRQGNAAILEVARRVGAGDFSFPANELDPFAARD